MATTTTTTTTTTTLLLTTTTCGWAGGTKENGFDAVGMCGMCVIHTFTGRYMGGFFFLPKKQKKKAEVYRRECV